MNVGSTSTAMAQASGSIKMMSLVQDQMKADGKSAVKLIDKAGSVQQASPAHNGKGHRVNLLA